MTFLPRAMSPFRRYLGVGYSVVALGVAGWAAVTWMGRDVTPAAVAAPSDARAWMLLERSLRADAQTPFSAHVQTVVFAGSRQAQSEAQLWHAPGQIAVSYLSGPMRGQQSGYSQRWFWRQESGGPLQSYAEVARSPAEMARARFELMRQNYRAQLQAPRQIDGRTVEVVELLPRHPARGARGPARRVFIDAQTSLTLRTEAFNYRLQPVSHSTFSHLNLTDLSTANFESPAAIAQAAKVGFWQGEELGRDERAVEAKSGLTPPQSDHLPSGFTVDGMGVHRCVRSVPGLQLAAFTRYTDGLNELTLFAVRSVPLAGAPLAGASVAVASITQAPDVVTLPPSGKSADMNCNFGPATVISRAQSGGTLVAMGDLPVEVLQRALRDAQFNEVAPGGVAPGAGASGAVPAAITAP